MKNKFFTSSFVILRLRSPSDIKFLDVQTWSISTSDMFANTLESFEIFDLKYKHKNIIIKL